VPVFRILIFLFLLSAIISAQNAPLRVCGFSQQFPGRLSREPGKPALQKVSAPVRQYQISTAQGHFTLHFDLEGVHAVAAEDTGNNGIPDYIDSAMVILEQVWSAEIDQLGFNPPPGIDGQAVSAYPVYFTQFFDDRLYGQTWVDEPVNGSGETRFTSYLELRQNYESAGLYTKGFDALRVTAAHEFHHAVQIGYYLRLEEEFPSDIFLMEMSSVWMEDQVFDQINDYYQYLEYLFGHIHQYPLDGFEKPQMAYGHALFLKMLSEKYSPALIRKIWESIPEKAGLNAVQEAVQSESSSFSAEFMDYASWLLFTGERTLPGYYFEDAQNYPLLPGTAKNTYSFTVNLSLSGELPARQMAHYFLTSLNDSLLLAKISLQEDQDRVLGAVYTTDNPAGLVLAAGEQKSFFIRPQAEIWLALCNPAQTNSEEWQIDLRSAVQSTVANPLVIRTDQGELRFYGLNPGARIDLFTLNGAHISSLQTGDTSTEAVLNVGDLATGIYLYAIRGSGRQNIGKVAIIRK